MLNAGTNSNKSRSRVRAIHTLARVRVYRHARTHIYTMFYEFFITFYT